MRRLLSPLALVPVFVLGACGGSTSDVATEPPASVAFATTTTPVDAQPGTVVTEMAEGSTMVDGSVPADVMSAGTDGVTGAGSMVVSAEMLSSMLATEQGHAMVVQGMAAQTGIDEAAAACFVDTVDLETVAALSGMSSTGDDPLAALSADALAEMQQVLDTCGIAPETFLG